MLKIYSRF